MKKFQCKQCGKCCKDFSSEGINNFDYPCFNAGGVLFFLRKPQLMIYPFEKNKLLKIAKELEIELEIKPLMIIFDIKKEITHIASYNISGPCPLLSLDNKCLAYSDRPLVCKSHPFTIDVMEGISTKNIEYVPSNCPNDIPIEQLYEQCSNKNIKDTLKIFNDIYGDIFKANLEVGLIRNHLFRIIDELIESNSIRPAKEGCNINGLLKRIERSKKIDLEFPEHIINEIKNQNFSTKVVNDILLKEN